MFEARVGDLWPQVRDEHIRAFMIPTMPPESQSGITEPRMVLVAILDYAWKHELAAANEAIENWTRSGADQTTAAALVIDAAMKAAKCANFINRAYEESHRHSLAARRAKSDTAIEKFLRWNADLWIRSPIQVLVLDLAIIQIRRWMDRLHNSTATSFFAGRLEPGLIRAWKTGGGVPCLAAQSYAQKWREHCWEPWAVTPTGYVRNLSAWLRLGSMDRLPDLRVPADYPLIDKLIDWLPSMLVSTPERFERSSTYRLSIGEYGELIAACEKQQANWQLQADLGGSDDDGPPPAKPGGWTKKELVEQAETSGGTFDRIRKLAAVSAGEKGGKGQHRRYSNAELRKLIKAVELSTCRKRIAMAAAWREWLPRLSTK